MTCPVAISVISLHKESQKHYKIWRIDFVNKFVFALLKELDEFVEPEKEWSADSVVSELFDENL